MKRLGLILMAASLTALVGCSDDGDSIPCNADTPCTGLLSCIIAGETGEGTCGCIEGQNGAQCDAVTPCAATGSECNLKTCVCSTPYQYSAAQSKLPMFASTRNQEPLPIAPYLGGQAKLETRFSWVGVKVGPPQPVDLAMGFAGIDQPLLQVFSRNGRPFIKVGMTVVPIERTADYSLSIMLDDAQRSHPIAVRVLKDGAQQPIVSERMELPLAAAALWWESPRDAMQVAPVVVSSAMLSRR